VHACVEIDFISTGLSDQMILTNVIVFDSMYSESYLSSKYILFLLEGLIVQPTFELEF
jgi:hypothetical protein